MMLSLACQGVGLCTAESERDKPEPRKQLCYLEHTQHTLGMQEGCHVEPGVARLLWGALWLISKGCRMRAGPHR